MGTSSVALDEARALRVVGLLGVVQRSPALHRHLVDVALRLDDLPQDEHVAPPGRDAHRGLAVVRLCVDVALVIQQHLDDLGLLLVDGDVQGGEAVDHPGPVGARLGVKQPLEALLVEVLDADHHGGLAVEGEGLARIRAGLQQGADAEVVPPNAGQVKRRGPRVPADHHDVRVGLGGDEIVQVLRGVALRGDVGGRGAVGSPAVQLRPLLDEYRHALVGRLKARGVQGAGLVELLDLIHAGAIFQEHLEDARRVVDARDVEWPSAVLRPLDPGARLHVQEHPQLLLVVLLRGHVHGRPQLRDDLVHGLRHQLEHPDEGLGGLLEHRLAEGPALQGLPGARLQQVVGIAVLLRRLGRVAARHDVADALLQLDRGGLGARDADLDVPRRHVTRKLQVLGLAHFQPRSVALLPLVDEHHGAAIVEHGDAAEVTGLLDLASEPLLEKDPASVERVELLQDGESPAAASVPEGPREGQGLLGGGDTYHGVLRLADLHPVQAEGRDPVGLLELGELPIRPFPSELLGPHLLARLPLAQQPPLVEVVVALGVVRDNRHHDPEVLVPAVDHAEVGGLLRHFGDDLHEAAVGLRDEWLHEQLVDLADRHVLPGDPPAIRRARLFHVVDVSLHERLLHEHRQLLELLDRQRPVDRVEDGLSPPPHVLGHAEGGVDGGARGHFLLARAAASHDHRLA
mmetsp:Transcript_23877/g.71074  ORF Transcript_23877/g.71074 Transcript_23877/m.71074 type:complete len:687 (-) Transcript_23877:53-2113(-)